MIKLRRKRGFPITYTALLDMGVTSKLEMEIPIDEKKFDIIAIGEACGD